MRLADNLERMQIHVTIPDERAEEINAQLVEEAHESGLDLEHYLTAKLTGAKVAPQGVRLSAREAVDELRRLRQGNVLGDGVSIRELIEEGRKY